MRNPVDAVSMWLVKRSIRNEECLVKEPNRFARLAIRDLVSLILAALGWALFVNYTSWWHAVLGVAVAGWIGSHCFVNVRRATAYRSGWVDGRFAMISALQEAMARGMSPEEWVRAEMVRDLHVMGMPSEADEQPAEQPRGQSNEDDPRWGA